MALSPKKTTKQSAESQHQSMMKGHRSGMVGGMSQPSEFMLKDDNIQMSKKSLKPKQGK